MDMFAILVVVLLVGLFVFLVATKKFKQDVDEADAKRKKKEDGLYYYESYSIDFKRSALKIKKFVIIGVIVAIVIMTICSTIYWTNEQQIGFTSIFGHNTIIEGPGLHFKVPFVSKNHIYDATTQGMAIGYSEETNESMEEDSMMITSDFNFVNIDFYIEYRISDPIEHCYGTNNPINVLKNIAQSSIRNTVGLYDVDSVMTTGRSEIEAKVFDDMLEEIQKHNLGITITNVTIQDAEAPTQEVSKAFTDVSDAKTEAETAINSANSYRNTQIPSAEAEVEKVKLEANAEKTERINAAKEEVARFEALYQEYENNPETVRTRLYYETLEEILPNMEIIIGKDTKLIYVKDNAGGASGISMGGVVKSETNE